MEVIDRHPQSRVYLGFNRPKSRMFLSLMKSLDAQSGPLMINWFVAGHSIPDNHWYFSESEGGRVLGNLCHWTDLTLQMVGVANAFPCTISPANSSEVKSNFAFTITFADGSQAAFTFSAKGELFEGVREHLNVHRGDVLASVSDFRSARIDDGERKREINLRHRDHGHGTNIIHSYRSFSSGGLGEDRNYIIGTAVLMLKVKESLEKNEVTSCTGRL